MKQVDNLIKNTITKINKSKYIIAKERDKLRDLHSDLETFIEDLDMGIEQLEFGCREIESGLDTISGSV